MIRLQLTFIPLYRARDLQDFKQEWSYSDLTNSCSRWIFFLLRHCFQDQAQGYARTESMLCTDPSHHSYAATELISSMNLLKASSYLNVQEEILKPLMMEDEENLRLQTTYNL